MGRSLAGLCIGTGDWSKCCTLQFGGKRGLLPEEHVVSSSEVPFRVPKIMKSPVSVILSEFSCAASNIISTFHDGITSLVFSQLR